MHTVHNVTEDEDGFTFSQSFLCCCRQQNHPWRPAESSGEAEEVILQDGTVWEDIHRKGSSAALSCQSTCLQIMTVTRAAALHSPAWAAAPSSVSCRRRAHLDPPWPHAGRSPWPSGPPGSELGTGPRKPGRSQTHVPERFPHSPVSFPEINETRSLVTGQNGHASVQRATILQPKISWHFVVQNKAVCTDGDSQMFH